MSATLYLIPSLLSENGVESIPPSIKNTVEKCQVFYVENERTARRFLKKIWKEMNIDSYEWVLANKETIATHELIKQFQQHIKEGKQIGVLSEAGCPGIADPGQVLVEKAHQWGAKVVPLVGPSSILLALMASGLNGQQFTFHGYLPIDPKEREKAIRDLEMQSAKSTGTQLFIETPYRNNALFDTLVKTLRPTTKLCVAANITDTNEFIQTHTVKDWAQKRPELHKQPALFLFQA
ncbi:MAG: SAM-dependent methyltransferase [Chitinophagaceae bacterium]|uniref:SAM-dependent methyltransferase n=1 Tax=unclassified Paraflavitalea TaxID=2798305 RepID=UPI003D339069|nr:SAM-dependent methyltransferase [Chitinophagaceae bacterium]